EDLAKTLKVAPSMMKGSDMRRVQRMHATAFLLLFLLVPMVIGAMASLFVPAAISLLGGENPKTNATVVLPPRAKCSNYAVNRERDLFVRLDHFYTSTNAAIVLE